METGNNKLVWMSMIAISFVLIGCSGGSQTGNDVPQFTSPIGRTVTNNTPTNSNNNNQANEEEEDEEEETAGEAAPTNQEILDAILGQNEKLEMIEASSKKAASKAEDADDAAGAAMWASIAGGLANLGATGVATYLTHKKMDAKSDELQTNMTETKRLVAAGNILSAEDFALSREAEALQRAQAEAANHFYKNDLPQVKGSLSEISSQTSDIPLLVDQGAEIITQNETTHTQITDALGPDGAVPVAITDVGSKIENKNEEARQLIDSARESGKQMTETREKMAEAIIALEKAGKDYEEIASLFKTTVDEIKTVLAEKKASDEQKRIETVKAVVDHALSGSETATAYMKELQEKGEVIFDDQIFGQDNMTNDKVVYSVDENGKVVLAVLR